MVEASTVGFERILPASATVCVSAPVLVTVTWLVTEVAAGAAAEISSTLVASVDPVGVGEPAGVLIDSASSTAW